MKKFPIDLSCLTEEEISQFQEDPYTLYNGDQDVALYLRYSSTGQSDQSIEGQLRDCPYLLQSKSIPALWQSMLIEQRPLVKMWKSGFTSWK